MNINTKKYKKRFGLEDKYPGLSLVNFRFLFRKLEEAMRTVNYPSFPSPYSIIPFIAQAIGLDIPLMGSGKSPYSIISYSKYFKKNIFLEKDKGLTYEQRRALIDELYDMIAPYLLKEEEGYIDLLIATKYKMIFQELDSLELSEFRNITIKKFRILQNFLSKVNFVGGDYSHIAHYGYLEDLYREQSFLKNFDVQALKIWSENAYPIVLEMQIDGFNYEKKAICGWYILVPNYTEELLRSKSLRQKKLLQAGMLAKKLGAKFAGMAGLIASFSKGGNFLANNITNFGLTTGHSFTIANIYQIAKNIMKTLSLDFAKCKVGIVGAAGSIGSGVAKLISENCVKDILLVDMPNMVSTAKLSKLKEALTQMNPKNNIEITTVLEDVRKCDLLIIATNATSSFIRSGHLKSGAVVIDDSFPKNVSRELIRDRDDIILLEGGVSQFPRNLNTYVARNIPDLLDLSVSKLVSCKQAYGCLCESFILAVFKHHGNYGLGDADPALAKDIWEKGKTLGISSAVFQNYGFAVEKNRIEKVKKIISDRNIG